MATLNDLKVKQTGRIRAVNCDGAVPSRLMAMGLLPGRLVRVLGVAPLGDPILVELDGWQLSLRRNEAASLQVDLTP